MKRIAAGTMIPVAYALAALLAGPATADAVKPVGVVELFTSQGCSSCPPADTLLGELVTRSDVIALAYHVTYWDYLGWRDTLGSEDGTERQYDYGKAFGARSVYTPQAVINGRTDVNGADRAAVTGQIASLARDGKGLTVDLAVTRVGGSIMIDAGPGTGATDTAHLILVYYDEQRPVVIERGENKGKTMTYWNAVSNVQAAGIWHGKAARFELPASEIDRKEGCVALLQAVDKKGLPGAILGAAIVRGAGAVTQ